MTSYDFTATGAAAVARAFRRIEQRARRHTHRVTPDLWGPATFAAEADIRGIEAAEAMVVSYNARWWQFLGALAVMDGVAAV